MDIWIALLTGLTTGGLSCMAVQGGLLAGSLANQIENDMKLQERKGFKPQLALPIVLFLISKLVIYTLAGFILGALGSVFQLSASRGLYIQMAAACYIIGMQ